MHLLHMILSFSQPIARVLKLDMSNPKSLNNYHKDS